jgi:hypothetical protein
MGLDDVALATTCTGEATVAPFAGELMVTAPGGLTVMVTWDLKTVPFESQACTTSTWLPVAMLIEVSILLEELLYTLTLST